MHVFKTQGIVLQVGKISERELWYKIFFQEYGILIVQKQKKVREKPIDIGYHISCEILTQEHKKNHTIGNITVLGYFESLNRPYKEIEMFLKIIAGFQKNTQNGVPHQELFSLLKNIIGIKEAMRYEKMILLALKIYSILGTLPENHSHKICNKIVKYVHHNQSKDIIRLGNIPGETLKILETLL